MIGIIGYRNHSLKILNILLKLNYRNLVVYCKNKNNLKTINKNVNYVFNLKELKKCKIIFICSPANTHFKYIKMFTDSKRYIFCEKPSVTTNYAIKKLQSYKKNNIYFNFNYVKSRAFDFIKKEIKDKRNGELIHINISATHGLFFKENYKNNWRNNSLNIFDKITGNLGIHYINFALNLIGKIKKFQKSESKFSKRGVDTSLINLEFEKGKTVTIFLSYASVMTQDIKIFFTNSIFEINNNKIYKFYPRDYFNKKGMFTKPHGKLISKNVDLSVQSLENSIKYFMDVIQSKNNLDRKLYLNSLMSSKVLLNK